MLCPNGLPTGNIVSPVLGDLGTQFLAKQCKSTNPMCRLFTFGTSENVILKEPFDQLRVNSATEESGRTGHYD